MVEYKYNAWGYHTLSGSKASTIGAINPFRYRSYFYDTETGFYFLKTRYYDPEVGRFLNMDSVTYADPEATNGLNLYVYCGNNPVNNIDPTGHIALSVILISMLIGALIGGTVSGVEAVNSELDVGAVVLSVLGGAIMGAAVSGAFTLGVAAATGLTIAGNVVAVSGVALFGIATGMTAGAGAIDYALNSCAYGTNTSLDGYFMSAVEGSFEGIVSFGFGFMAGSKGYFNHAESNIFNPYKTYEMVTRSILFSVPSMLIRNLFKKAILK